MRKLGQAYALIAFSEITPTGWMRDQLRIQADGLSGHLQTFWPDIADSQWIGGKADAWERVPYWLDGFIPLAYLLHDQALIDVASFYVDSIIARQNEDGFLCPITVADRSRYDVWSVFLMLKVLVLYHELTGDERIEYCVTCALKALSAHLDRHTLFDWGHMRWFECLIPLWWLYARRPENWMLRLYHQLATQGFDWRRLFRDWPYQNVKKSWGWDNHVVNNAMAVKSGILEWRYTASVTDRELPEQMYRMLMANHGMVTGVFTGDECLAGTSPIQGTELCAVVELMYALEQLLLLTGDPVWGDRLERAAFNALPAAFSPDMWTHQYDQQVNQVQCSQQETPVFYTNGGDANLFGLEPHFGCCTANFSQGWPKLVCHAFMQDDEGFVSAILVPSRIDTQYRGTKLGIELITDYPFRDELTYVIRAESPVECTLKIRIPEWADQARITWMDREELPQAGKWHKIRATWHGETEIRLRLPMQPTLVHRQNGLCAVTYGPLVFALPIKARWVRTNTQLPHREYPHCDYEVYPASDWQYGWVVDEQALKSSIVFEQRPIGDCPFSPEGAPVVARVKVKEVAWPITDGVCALAPAARPVSEKLAEIELIPYGCTNLRITELPLIK